MNYWQMELHPDEKILNFDVKKLLEEESVIGLSNTAKDIDVKNFKDKMQIGDIIVIRKSTRPVALIEVVGKYEDVGKKVVNQLAWFKYIRVVKVLEYAKNRNDFPFSYGSFRIATGAKTKTYLYIYDWYEKVRKKQYAEGEQKRKSYKIKSVYIKHNKILSDFKLDLTTNNKLMPVVVLAGKNGTGKTTLLEYLVGYKGSGDDYVKIGTRTESISNKLVPFLDPSSFKIKEGMDKIRAKIKEYKEHIQYFPLTINDYDEVENEIVNYYIYRGKIEDLKRSEMLGELQLYVDKIFKGFDLAFKISDVDLQRKHVFFKNKNGENEEFRISELSSGEKTLLSKVLYLYLKRIKNKIILIDEPEQSLHPAWQNRVLEIYETFAKNNNCQIIIATHSPHIIGSAKNEYIRILKFNDEGNVEVINDVVAYGRDVAWVLEEVMGAEYTREKAIVANINEIENLLSDEKYDDAEKKLNNLESIIGKQDVELVRLRTVLDFERD